MQIDKSIAKPKGKEKKIARSSTLSPRLGRKPRFITQTIPETAAPGKLPQTVYHTVVIPSIPNDNSNTALSVSTNPPNPSTDSTANFTPTPASNPIASLSALPKRFASTTYDSIESTTTASSSSTSSSPTPTIDNNLVATPVQNPKRVVTPLPATTQLISTSTLKVSQNTTSTHVAIPKRVATSSKLTTDMEIKRRKLMEKEKNKKKRQRELLLQYVIGMQHAQAGVIAAMKGLEANTIALRNMLEEELEEENE